MIQAKSKSEYPLIHGMDTIHSSSRLYLLVTYFSNTFQLLSVSRNMAGLVLSFPDTSVSPGTYPYFEAQFFSCSWKKREDFIEAVVCGNLPFMVRLKIH